MDSAGVDVASLVNELRKAQETIHELEQRTRTILDSIHAGIVIIDPEPHQIIDVNPEAAAVIERLRKGIEQQRIMLDDGTEVRFSISAGVAQLAGPAEEWESIMRRADQALYRAKKSGRNRVGMAPGP